MAWKESIWKSSLVITMTTSTTTMMMMMVMTMLMADSNKLRLTFKVKSRDIRLITGHSFFSVAQERRPPEDDIFLKRGVEKRMKRLHTCRNSLVPVTSCSPTARQPTKQDDKMSRKNYTRKLSRSTNENASQCTVRTCRICSTRLLAVLLSSAFRGFFLYILN